MIGHRAPAFRRRAILAWGVVALAAAQPSAVPIPGNERFVAFAPAPNACRLAADGIAAPIIVDSLDFAGVRRAAADLQADVFRVTAISLRYAISFEDEAPTIVNVHADDSLAAWEKSVADGAKILTTRHAIARPGAHVLKLWAVDAGLVLQKIVVYTGRPRPSYLGPPESARGRGPSPSS